MLARDAERTSTLRMIQAKLKDTDIAARPKGIEAVPDEEILALQHAPWVAGESSARIS